MPRIKKTRTKPSGISCAPGGAASPGEVEDDGFIGSKENPPEIGGGVFVVGDEHPVFPAGEGKALGQVKFGLLFGKVVYDQKRLAFQTARIGPQAGMVFQKEFVFSVGDDIVVFPQPDQFL